MPDQPETTAAQDATEMKNAWMYWKLAIWRLLFGSLTVAGSGYIAATSAVKWGSMTGDERILIVITLSIAVGKFVDAFLDQTVSRLIAGKTPVSINGNGNGNGNTEYLARRATEREGARLDAAAEKQKVES